MANVLVDLPAALASVAAAAEKRIAHPPTSNTVQVMDVMEIRQAIARYSA